MTLPHEQAREVAGRRPCLAVDTLMTLPWPVRMRAYEDFDRAISLWAMARRDRRAGGWQWRLDMHRALRFWAHYKRAVRAAQNTRIAA